MRVPSVLFPAGVETEITESEDAPVFFEDLNLDQVINSLIVRKQEYNLKPFFNAPFMDYEVIKYRQEIFRDLEIGDVFKAINTFAEKMASVRRYLKMIEKLTYRYHVEGWFLEAASVYCEAVSSFDNELGRLEIKSRGLLAILEYLDAYIASSEFQSLQSDTCARKLDISAIRYNIVIKGNLVKVQQYENEFDYSEDVEDTFERFKQGDVKNYRIDLVRSSGMSHVEAQILEFVARLNPTAFRKLDSFLMTHNGFVNEGIMLFDRQIQFYVSYFDFIAGMKYKGLSFCYPEVAEKEKNIYAKETFDIALANELVLRSLPVICNDFFLQGNERVIVVSGPNQGGKTTFARMFGQLHYLASLGCPVPGKEAVLYLCDQIFTHFEKEEDIRNLRGKLQEDLVRIHAILEKATSTSIIILNEIFTSTTLSDAIFLSKEIIKKIISLDALCVCVSFIDELSTMGEQTVSMVSTVVPHNPSQRTFKIIRKPADGLSYAICIAEKYKLTYKLIQERISL